VRRFEARRSSKGQCGKCLSSIEIGPRTNGYPDKGAPGDKAPGEGSGNSILSTLKPIHNESVLLFDLAPFAKMATAPDRSAFTVAEAISDLLYLQDREETAHRLVHNLVFERQKLIGRLMETLEAELARLDGTGAAITGEEGSAERAGRSATGAGVVGVAGAGE